MIDARTLTKTYGDTAQRVVALDTVSLHVERGARVAIIGKSGSGKSTLLNILAGMDRPTSGIVSVADRRLDQLNRRALAEFRAMAIGIVFQSFQLLPQQTALQNVELPLALGNVPRGNRRSTAMKWLDRVGLSDRADHLPYALSGGEQQRVAIARALVHEPGVLLADEPTGNLDSSTAMQVEDLILELCSEHNTTFVLVTHDNSLATRCADRQYQMTNGRLLELG